MTVLLDLPNEILEVVVDHLITSIENDLLAEAGDEDPHIAPHLPVQPYGHPAIVPFRLVCKTFQALVDQRNFQSVEVTLCAHNPTKGLQGRDLCSLHEDCMNLYPAGRPPETWWPPAQRDSILSKNVQNLTVNVCYGVLPIESVDAMEATTIVFSNVSVTWAMYRLAQSARRLRLAANLGTAALHCLRSFGSTVLTNAGIIEAGKLPALRELDIEDLSLFTYLPEIALNAPLLEDVTLRDAYFWVEAPFMEVLQRRYRATAESPLRLPPTGTWKTLRIIAEDSLLGDRTDVMQNIYDLSGCLAFGVDTLAFQWLGCRNALYDASVQQWCDAVWTALNLEYFELSKFEKIAISLCGDTTIISGKTECLITGGGCWKMCVAVLDPAEGMSRLQLRGDFSSSKQLNLGQLSRRCSTSMPDD